MMWRELNGLEGTSRRRALIATSVIASLAAFAYAMLIGWLALDHRDPSLLIGDIFLYADISDLLVDGFTAYIHLPVVHLPIALVPIAGLSVTATVTTIPIWIVWPVGMSAAFVGSVLLVDTFDPERPAGFMYVALSLPMLPLVLFRLEPWVVLLAIGAIAAFMARKTALGVFLTIAGALGKGWPIVVAILPWKRSQKGGAIVATLGSFALLALVGTHEGFRSGRQLEGIHTETLMGSIILLGKHLSGEPFDFMLSALALNIAAPGWIVVANAIPGALVAGVALVVARRKLTGPHIVSLIGFGVLAIILLSPLFSTQFVFWLAPFVAGTSATIRRLYVAASVVALASISVFVFTSPMWAIEVFIVNMLFLVLAFEWGRELLDATRPAGHHHETSTSRKNLPV